MRKLEKRLNELMEETVTSIDDIVSYLGLNHSSNVYEWLEGNTFPRFATIIKLANLFKCSTDFLLGRTDNLEEISPKTDLPDFKLQFKKVLNNRGLKRCNLENDNILSSGHLNRINKNKYLSVENMIKVADYLGVSIDFLIGRE